MMAVQNHAYRIERSMERLAPFDAVIARALAMRRGLTPPAPVEQFKVREGKFRLQSRELVGLRKVQILKALLNGPLLTTDVARTIRCDAELACSHISQLRRLGLIVATGKRGPGRSLYWTLTSEGRSRATPAPPTAASAAA